MNQQENKPSFPLTIFFHEDGDIWTLNNEIEVATNLEWFDSTSPDEKASVKDSLGRSVILLVEELEVKQCTLE